MTTPDSEDNDCDCIVTFEQTKQRLEEIEQQLAVRLSLQGTVEGIRQQLYDLEYSDQLVEDEVVATWHEYITVYLDWIQWNKRQEDK